MNIGSTKDSDQQIAAEKGAVNVDPASTDPGVALYRDIFGALREPVPVELPEGFGARVARIARAGQGGVEAAADRWLAIGLYASLAVILAWSLLAYLPGLLSSVARSSSGTGTLFFIEVVAVLAMVSGAEMALRRQRPASSRRRRPKSW